MQYKTAVILVHCHTQCSAYQSTALHSASTTYIFTEKATLVDNYKEHDTLIYCSQIVHSNLVCTSGRCPSVSDQN